MSLWRKAVAISGSGEIMAKEKMAGAHGEAAKRKAALKIGGGNQHGGESEINRAEASWRQQ